MIADQHRRVKVLFEAAMRRPPGERSAYLDRACGPDTALRAEVESLLACGRGPTAGLLDPGEGWLAERFRELLGSGVGGEAGGAGAQDADEALIGRRIGRYRVARRIAAGGMGAVYEAEQESPRRTVALKIMRCALASRSAQRRFDYESQILASLRHPWIAQVYEAGVHREPGAPPLPWFAMELVPGAMPITTFARERQLDIRQRLELFAKVCEAVHHGAMKGVIHRDLKPSNILVDAAGEPKIIDFGVARATDSDLAMTTLRTEAGQLIGTLQYMSPEQVGGALGEQEAIPAATIGPIRPIGPIGPIDLDTRSDVYALGVVLYELLCGSPPYDVARCPVLEAARLIREAIPPRPATLDRSLRGDIETIVLKALEKDRTRRYQSALELGRDIRRYLSGEAILARPPSAAYQARVFARRHKAAVGALAAVIAVLSGAVVAMSILAVQLRAERDRAEAEAKRALAAEAEAEAIAEFQAQQLGGIDPAAMGQQIRADLLSRAREAFSRDGEPAGEGDDPGEELQSLLSGVNFTDVALRTLEESFFKRTLAAIDKEFADRPRVQARLLQTIAIAARDMGLLTLAAPAQERALAIRLELLGPVHEDTLSSRISDGILLLNQARTEEGEARLRLALAAARRELGGDHRVSLDALLGCALASHNRGHYAEAEELYREALAVNRRLFGDEGPEVASVLGNLGIALAAQNKGGEAVSALGESAALFLGLHGVNSTSTVWAVQYLGVELLRQGRLEEAASALREALDGYTRLKGSEHPRTIQAMLRYGRLLMELGDLEAAEQMMAQAVTIGRQSLSPQESTLMWCLLRHGEALSELRRFDEAELRMHESHAALEECGLALRNPTLAQRFTTALASALADLYEAWHAAEPEAGYGARAAEWRAAAAGAEPVADSGRGP